MNIYTCLCHVKVNPQATFRQFGTYIYQPSGAELRPYHREDPLLRRLPTYAKTVTVMKQLQFLLLALSIAMIGTSCLQDSADVTTYVYSDEELSVLQQHLELDNEEIDYKVHLPSHVVGFGSSNPNINSKKALLGRVLFYDNELSLNREVNCSSCHLQERAFADKVAFSEGFDGQKTKRNSLALGAVPNFETSYDNPGNRAFFFWDERAETIAEQSVLTIQDDIEMGMDMGALVDRLNGVDYYRVLFNKAYGSEEVTEGRITEALEEFVNALSSADSKFDRAMPNSHFVVFDDFEGFTPSENLGKSLYQNNCAGCHGHNLTSVSRTLANNGLDVVYEDQGRYDITGNEADKGLFKVPVLRNIELTGPYMHDGRFETLEEVVEHYSSGVQLHPNLSPELHDFSLNEINPRRLHLDDYEKTALVDFLKTLTDHTFIAERRFSDPFKR